MKSHKDLMGDYPTELAALDESITRAATSINALMDDAPPSSRSDRGLKIMLSREGRDSLRRCAEGWNVSLSTVVRVLVADGLVRHGFMAKGVIVAKDAPSLRRPDSKQKPFQTKEQSARIADTVGRRPHKNVLLGSDLGGDNPPQP